MGPKIIEIFVFVRKLGYKRLHAQQAHAGIVSCTRDKDDPAGLAQRIHDAISATPNLANRFIRIVRPNPPGGP